MAERHHMVEEEAPLAMAATTEARLQHLLTMHLHLARRRLRPGLLAAMRMRRRRLLVVGRSRVGEGMMMTTMGRDMRIEGRSGLDGNVVRTCMQGGRGACTTSRCIQAFGHWR